MVSRLFLACSDLGRTNNARQPPSGYIGGLADKYIKTTFPMTMQHRTRITDVLICKRDHAPGVARPRGGGAIAPIAVSEIYRPAGGKADRPPGVARPRGGGATAPIAVSEIYRPAGGKADRPPGVARPRGGGAITPIAVSEIYGPAGGKADRPPGAARPRGGGAIAPIAVSEILPHSGPTQAPIICFIRGIKIARTSWWGQVDAKE